MIKKLVELIADWCAQRGRILKITGQGRPDDVYLIRYYVFKSKWFNVFIHRFLRSDRDDLHDHPWDFLTYLVSGAYTEYKWRPTKVGGYVQRTRRANYRVKDAFERLRTKLSFNTLVFRRAETQHKVVLDEKFTMTDMQHAPLTVCITGPTRREWGFIREEPSYGEFSPAGALLKKKRVWVPWREYLGLPDDEPGRG
jgi:hypothetical protein